MITFQEPFVVLLQQFNFFYIDLAWELPVTVSGETVIFSWFEIHTSPVMCEHSLLESLVAIGTILLFLYIWLT